MAWPRDAYVGQKVVFIGPPEDTGTRGWGYECGAVMPEPSRVYTVRSVWIAPKGRCMGRPVFRLVECDNSHMPKVCGEEPGFDARQFIPIDSAKKKSARAVRALLDDIVDAPPLVPEDAL